MSNHFDSQAFIFSSRNTQFLHLIRHSTFDETYQADAAEASFLNRYTNQMFQISRVSEQSCFRSVVFQISRVSDQCGSCKLVHQKAQIRAVFQILLK